MLAGIVQEGDHVDVVATAKYHFKDIARATSRVALRNWLWVEPAEDAKQASVGGAPTTTSTLVMTDRQAQTMGWAEKQATWFFVLRPTKKPLNTSPPVDTPFTIVG